MFFFHFAYPLVLAISLPIVAMIAIVRSRWRRPATYRYPLTSFLLERGLLRKKHKSFIMMLLRISILILCCLIASRPQWVDQRSKIDIQGVDMVLALDISGSMQLFDDLNDRRPRIKVAKTEAINFINKRTNDPIGVVVFATQTLTLAPPTMDKHLLREAVDGLEIGFVDPNETALAQGLATAVSRLRHSQAKSKIVILLTDGQPTGNSTVTVDQSIKFAKKFGIKIYTIGVGNENGGYVEHFGRVIAIGKHEGGGVDKDLLQKISRETGGKFFEAQSPKQMKDVYNTIDNLEKTKQSVDIFSRYYEAVWLFALPLLILLAMEILLKTWFWRGLAW